RMPEGEVPVEVAVGTDQDLGNLRLQSVDHPLDQRTPAKRLQTLVHATHAAPAAARKNQAGYGHGHRFCLHSSRIVKLYGTRWVMQSGSYPRYAGRSGIMARRRDAGRIQKIKRAQLQENTGGADSWQISLRRNALLRATGSTGGWCRRPRWRSISRSAWPTA